MASDEQKNTIVNNVGCYVIKVGDAYVEKYKSVSLVFWGKNFPATLVPRLGEVKEFIYEKDKAKAIAKSVNGKVYQICVEPVEDD